MRRDQKEQLRDELNEIFSKANNAVILSFSGFTVNDVNNLRRKLREENCNYRVIKNRIAKIAAKGTPMENPIRVTTWIWWQVCLQERNLLQNLQLLLHTPWLLLQDCLRHRTEMWQLYFLK